MRSLRWWSCLVLRSCVVVVLFFVGVGRAGAEMTVANGTWDSRFVLPPGLNGDGAVMVSVGNYLVVGGSFTRAGKVQARNLALWDGKNWKEFAGGANAPVTAMVLNGTGLYIAGMFTEVGGVAASGVARWNGSKWEALNIESGPSGIYSSGIITLYWQGGNLYAGGIFPRIGGVSCNGIARWDGRKWHAMGQGVSLPIAGPSNLGTVFSITGDGHNIYVGGRFTQAGSIQATNLARWNGERWSRVGDFVMEMPEWYGSASLNSWLGKVAFVQGKLYVAGGFSKVDGNAITNFARWNGSTWQNPGSVDGYVNWIGEYSGGLMVAGSFQQVGGVAATNLALLKNGKWTGLGVNSSGIFYGADIQGNRIYLTGSFDLVNQVSAGNIVKYEGKKFSALGTGKGNSINGSVESLTSDGTNVYVTGNFDTAGVTPVSGLAKWDGIKWSSVGKPFRNLYVRRPLGLSWGISRPNSRPLVATASSNLYLAGAFEMPELGATNLACWNGKEWQALGGLTGQWTVDAMVSDGRKLYVSGDLVEEYRVKLSGVNAWDGTNWTAVPWKQNFGRPTLATDGSALYMASGSLFRWSFPVGIPEGTEPPPPEPVYTVAKWDGQTLTDFGEIPGLGWVDALAAQGNRIYVAGRMTNGTDSVLFRWDGNGWQQVGISFTSGASIRSIVLKGENVFLGGYFKTINGIPANGIVVWDGYSWKSLGLQSGSISTMLGSGNKLYVGGSSLASGGREWGSFGIWSAGAPPLK